MNLFSLKARLQQQANHVVTLNGSGYDKYLTDVINETYRDIWLSRAAEFNTRSATLRIWPDYTQADSGATLSMTQDTDFAVFSSSPFDGSDPLVGDKALGAYILYKNVYYRIDNVISDTVYKLDKMFEGDDVTGETEWSIIHRHVYLPQDCVDVMDIYWGDFPADRGVSNPARPLPRRHQTAMWLDSSITGTSPDFWILEDASEPLELPMPLEVIGESTSGGGHAQIASKTFHFGYTVVDATGAESSMCDTVSYTTAATSVGVTLQIAASLGGISNTDDIARYRYRIYVAVEESDTYKWYPVEDQDINFRGNTTATLNGDRMIEILKGNVEDRRWDGAKSVRAVRFWPRPVAEHVVGLGTGLNATSDYNYSVANIVYMFLPKDLVFDMDAPKLPAAFHHLIVMGALAKVYARFGETTLAAVEEQKLQAELRRLYARYASDTEIRHVMRTKTWGQRGRTYQQFSTPTHKVYTPGGS